MLSVLLMIRVNHAQRKVMGSRRVPCLDDYLDRVQLMLWPRFKVRLKVVCDAMHGHQG